MAQKFPHSFQEPLQDPTRQRIALGVALILAISMVGGCILAAVIIIGKIL